MIKYLFLLLALCITGCTTTPPVAMSDRAALWQEYQANLAGLANWVAQGRIAIRHENEIWHANVHWRQDHEQFDIQLFGPFGRDIARLRGDTQAVMLRTGEGDIYLAEHVDELTHDTLGWPLPVAGLRHWILGLPATKTPYDIVLNHQGRAEQLQQSGWEIRYERYQAHEPHLPARMRLQYQDIYLRVLIDKWHTFHTL